MKENASSSHTSEIIRPEHGTVEVGGNVDFVYIMREDTQYAMSPIALKLSEETGGNPETILTALAVDYDAYIQELSGILLWGYEFKGNFQLHLYDPDLLDSDIRKKAENSPIISLDPLMNTGVFEHKVSRGYYPGGIKDFGQVERPGSQLLSVQAKEISKKLNGTPAIITEDDIFSGGSVIASLQGLISAGVIVEKLVPGIQVGNPATLYRMGIVVDPIVTYKTTDGSDIFDKVDLGDPRDYLLGASGLVVKLPNGHMGRAPYILPFVSTSARAGIPKNIEKEFARHVLHINYTFFKDAGNHTGTPILLRHMHPDFCMLMQHLYGIDQNTSMTDVVTWSAKHMDDIWETTFNTGIFQEQLDRMHLPEKIIFLDVNGTLIPDDAGSIHISDTDTLTLTNAVLYAKLNGFEVGINSDSPLPQLMHLAAELDIDGPIAAENGNIIYYNGETIIIRNLTDAETYKAFIEDSAKTSGLVRAPDTVAREFGGIEPNYEEGMWSYGADRESSITVFGPPAFVLYLGEIFKHTKDVSCDASPQYNYFALHPGENYKKNKGRTLELLAKFGAKIIMIGNSMSDWVDPESGVQCAFVAGSGISENVRDSAAHVSNKYFIDGIADSISKLI